MRKSDVTKGKIFDAAVEEFAKKGFTGARIDSISRTAGVNKERIYAYFGNKENLFIEVWKETYGLIANVDNEFLKLTDEDIPHLGEIVLRRYMEFHDTHPTFWKIFAWENLLGGVHRDVVKDYKRTQYIHLQRLYAKGQKQGHYSRDVTFETFIFVITAFTFFYASNKETMSGTLGLDLTAAVAKANLTEECLTMLFRR